MTTHLNKLLAVFGILGSSIIFTHAAKADPLPGRDLTKFSQQPMINTTVVDSTGTVGVYQGHDELSTLYGFGNAAQPPVDYSGRFMADDFADNFNTPVVHVKWWGSYHNDFINPNMPVNRFLIAFESDIPANQNPAGYSQPGQVLQFDVVNRAPVIAGPGSGTFTEKLIRGPDVQLNESLYEYNAELHLNREFFEKQDTVYWLKIAALVDADPTITFPTNQPPAFATQWGWHNRDYTIQDALASPNVAPGEYIEGMIGNTPVWHFQDDAVTGDMRFVPQPQPSLIFQTNMVPTKYLDGIDGPAGAVPGAVGIGQFSKDLAFEIYTTVPEPASCSLVALGLAAVFATRRRSA